MLTKTVAQVHSETNISQAKQKRQFVASWSFTSEAAGPVLHGLEKRISTAAALRLRKTCRGSTGGLTTASQVVVQETSKLRRPRLQVERFLDSPAAGDPAGGGADAEAALAAQLAEWAAVNGQLQALSAMPLPAGLETAVLDWLVRL